MALASPSDVEARLGRPLTVDESLRVGGLLVEASASARAWMRCVSDPDPVPEDVALVVSRMAARVLAAPVGPSHLDQFSQTAGVFAQSGTYTEGATSGSPWLTKDDKRILRRHGCRGRAASFDTR